MKLTKPLKILILGLTIWPMIWVVLFMVFAVLMAANFHAILIAHYLTVLLVLGLTIFYLAHLVRASNINNRRKIAWAIALLWGNMIAMPIYFFAHVWPDDPTIPPSHDEA